MHGGLMRMRQRYYLAGASHGDVEQYARLGLWSGCRTYREGCGMSLRNFLSVAMERRVISAIRAARRLKHLYLNDSVSLDSPMPIGFDVAAEIGESIASQERDQARAFADQDEAQALVAALHHRLTPLEREVFAAYSIDPSYSAIAEATGRNPKAVDNAMIRIKAKAREVRQEFERAAA